MQNQNHRPPGERITLNGTFHAVHFLARAHAACFTVFTRHTHGAEALGFNGLGAFFLILFYAAFANAPEMFTFFWLWLMAQIIQRVRTSIAIGRGLQLHSQYGGYPWLGYRLQSVKTYRAAVFAEACAVFMTGALLYSISEAVGMFTIVGSLSMLAVYGINRMAITMEVRRMRDAELEMRMRADVFQGKYTDY